MLVRRILRRKWHIVAGHPMDAVEVLDGGEAGVRMVTFRCRQCGHSFDKQLPKAR